MTTLHIFGPLLDEFNTTTTINDDAYHGETSYNSSAYPVGADKFSSYNESSSSSSYYNSGDKSDPYGYGYDDPYGYSAGGYGDDKSKDKDKYGDLWYGALSVAVLTLGLILVVEEVRHRLDHAAIGRPFMQSVLDGCYRELATLGFVELAIHWLQTYSDLIDKDSKKVFADVHFLLFYTAIFNAFQAAILAFTCRYVSNRLWIQTEELEVDHYVEIREEFDRIHKKLYGEDQHDDARAAMMMQSKSKKSTFSRSFRNFTQSYSAAFDAEERGWMASVQKFMLGVYYTFVYPRVKAKYRMLLVQVRFHEMRVHFLQSYNLPLKMKVSDYLMKSLQHVLEHFVHVSHNTWLLLTAFCNILYFLMGISADVSGDAETSGYSLSLIFFCAMVVFVLISVFVYFRMEKIFKRLMKSKHLWNIWDDEGAPKRNAELADQQEAMFFMGDPHKVLNAIKFMQFGYAIALAVVFTYWAEMDKDDDFNASAYLFATLICYSVFVAVMSRVLPLYTICTSMGQLVDKERLHEVRSAYRLQEAERKRHKDMSMHGREEMFRTGHESTHSLTTLEVFDKDPSSEESASAVPVAEQKLLDSSEKIAPSTPPTDKRVLLAELVKMDTMTLRTIVPTMSDKKSSQKRGPREGRRSFSDGVRAMRDLGGSHTSATFNGSSGVIDGSEASSSAHSSAGTGRKVTFDDSTVQNRTTDHRQRRERRRTQSASATIQAMRDFKENEDFFGPPKGLDSSVSDEPTSNLSPSPKTSTEPPMDVDSTKGTVAVATAKIEKLQTNKETSTPIVANILSVIPERPHEAPPETKKSKNSDDDTSVSNLSDVENTSAWDKEHKHDHDDHHHHDKHSRSIVERLTYFFGSATYSFMTNILGTMVAFFLVGMRVEAFLKWQCIIPERDHSWELPLNDSFRLLIGWISSFIVVSLINVLISPHRRNGYQCIAATVDIILCAICLVLFLEAENQRCCNGDDFGEAVLDKEDLESQGLLDLNDIKVCTNDVTAECSCLEFGHRLYGGLGSVEPFVALIGLRVFRFSFAKWIAKTFFNLERTYHDRGHGHHGHGHAEEKGTAVELWQATICKHPELAEKHGEFSSELLQAMLGIEVIESKPPVPQKVIKEAKEPIVEESSTSSALVVAPQVQREHVFLEEPKFAKLNPEVQEIIAAGKLGRPVKSCLKQKSHAAPMAPLEFEFDQKTDEKEHDNLLSQLSYPNARLVRSMRRCERKLLPLLDQWMLVDVVITNHEMVYVDVNDTEDSEFDDEDIRKREASKSAVIATEGGKGLRLCDVVAGRRVVGHLSFSDILSVHVEREEPSDSSGPFPRENGGQNEFWQPESVTQTATAESRQQRWDKVNQDRLRLSTLHGTLYLRFHSDLADGELHTERILEEVGDESPLHKDIAFQWAMTIVRHCGVSQLQQELPNFGHDDDDELRDYLQIVKKDKKASHKRLTAFGHRRTPSKGLGRNFSFTTRNRQASVTLPNSVTAEEDEKTGKLVFDL